MSDSPSMPDGASLAAPSRVTADCAGRPVRVVDVAKAHRWATVLTYGAGLAWAAVAAEVALRGGPTLTTLAPASLVQLANAVAVGALAMWLGAPRIGAVVGIAVGLIPGMPVLMMAPLRNDARELFERAGVSVGALGAWGRDLERLRAGACSACGYSLRGLRGRACPECGSAAGEGA